MTSESRSDTSVSGADPNVRSARPARRPLSSAQLVARHLRHLRTVENRRALVRMLVIGDAIGERLTGPTRR
ncbi:MAG: hypothetical protein MJE77_47240 [Proteobacteria bacterium]|nr:hypothetical protein [Pseudomonadota bacterium]